MGHKNNKTLTINMAQKLCKLMTSEFPQLIKLCQYWQIISCASVTLLGRKEAPRLIYTQHKVLCSKLER